MRHLRVPCLSSVALIDGFLPGWTLVLLPSNASVVNAASARSLLVADRIAIPFRSSPFPIFRMSLMQRVPPGIGFTTIKTEHLVDSS